MRVLSAIAFISLVASTTSAVSAAIDCSTSAQPIDNVICADSNLATLDEYLDRYYRAALERLPEAAACLKADQRQWLKLQRNACAADKTCLTRAHLERLATLDGLQAGGSAIKTIELPDMPSLVTVIPPEGEGTKSKSGKPYKLDGTLLHEQQDINNMGYAVKPAKGPARAFVFDIDIGNWPAHETIQILMTSQPETRFRVSGLARPGGGFADGDCRFIYSLP